jgi:anti-sigma B factor antagonist
MSAAMVVLERAGTPARLCASRVRRHAPNVALRQRTFIAAHDLASGAVRPAEPEGAVLVPLIREISRGTGYLVIELSGEMDLATVGPARGRLTQIATESDGVVILDLAGVTFIDSTALSMFVGLHRTMTTVGRLLVLINVDRRAGRPISLTEVDRVITVHWADDEVPSVAELAHAASVAGAPDEALAPAD